jgi:hypothetical protein
MSDCFIPEDEKIVSNFGQVIRYSPGNKKCPHIEPEIPTRYQLVMQEVFTLDEVYNSENLLFCEPLPRAYVDKVKERFIDTDCQLS